MPLSTRANGTTLRLMCTTDVHGNLFPYDYYADQPDETVGLVRTATLIAAARAEVPDALLFDCGDFLQGSPLTDFAAEIPAEDDRPHPVIAAMNALRYDAVALGNHEFNHGLAVLTRALGAARFPVLCANAGGPRLALPASAMLKRRGPQGLVRIGVFGLVPPQILKWDRIHLEGWLSTEDAVAAAAREAHALKAGGADLVVALCHSGIGALPHVPGHENAALPVAELDAVDVVIFGHDHRPFPDPTKGIRGPIDPVCGRLAGKPAVNAGSRGAHLGLVDLELARVRGRWQVQGAEVSLRSIRGVADAPELAQQLLPAHRATLAHIARPIGATQVPLHSYFAQIAPCRALDVVADAQVEALRLRLASTPAAALPIVSAVAPFKAGGQAGPTFYTDVPAGPLSLRNAADLYLYPNAFAAVEATGEELRLWLERAAAQFAQIRPGERDVPLLDPDFPSHGYDILHGLTYSLDLSQPAMFDPTGAPTGQGRGRVRHLRHRGRPVGAVDRFAVATNAYRVGGGGGYPPWPAPRLLCQTEDSNRDLLVTHLRLRTVQRRRPRQVVRLRAPSGTTTLYDTGPGAARYADEVPGCTVLGPTQDGLLRFRLTF